MSARLFPTIDASEPTVLRGYDREDAERLIVRNHYTRSIPSGKSHYVGWRGAVICWSIPANNNIGTFLLGREANVWELSRMWAPDGHERNLLSAMIARAVGLLRELERPEILVSYADPNAGHEGRVYRAASWIYHGQSDEGRVYVAPDGQALARRAFHSGNSGMTKAEIEARGYREIYQPGKHRYVKPLTRLAKRQLQSRMQGSP